MDMNAVIALIGGALVAFVIRVFNVVVVWLAKVLGVNPPVPIPSDTAPTTAPDPVRPSPGTTGTNGGTSGGTAA